MKRTIINYTTFKSNEDFIKWQSEGEFRQIHQVQPQLMEIGMNVDELENGNSKSATGEGKTTFGVFVTYLTEINDEVNDGIEDKV